MTTKYKFYIISSTFIVIALLSKLVVLFFATPHWDTSYYLNIGLNYLEFGQLTPRMWRLGADTNIIAGSGTGYGILVPLQWYRVFGLSLISGRIMMYIVALLTLPIIYFTAALWWGRTAAIVAVVYSALNPMFFYNFTLRMDAFGTFAYTLVLLLHIYAIRSGRHRLHFLVGVAAIVVTEFHILGTIYLFGLATYYLTEQIKIIILQKRFIIDKSAFYYFSGALIAGIIYIVIHILPNYEQYFLISELCRNCTPRSIHKELERFIIFFIQTPVTASIFICALYALVRYRRANHLHYLIILLGMFFSIVVISPPTQIDYLGHLWPIMSIGIGGFFHVYVFRPNQITQQHILLATSIGLLMFIPYVARILLPQYAFYDAVRIDEDVVNYIQENIPKDTVIAGPPYAFVDLINYSNFMSLMDGEAYGILLRGESYSSFLERESPQVILNGFSLIPNVEDHLDVTSDILSYTNEHDFQQVIPDLFISSDFLSQLSRN